MRRMLPAELAAVALDVKPGTLRVWRHRGLIQPAGGTPNRPLYDAGDVLALRKSRAVKSADPGSPLAVRCDLWTSAQAAAYAHISVATLRDWKRRGIIQPAGGTPARPLYLPEDVRAAQRAPKPKRDHATAIDV